MCVLHVPYAYAAEDAEGQIGSLRVELKNQQLKARIESSPLFGGAAQVGIILSHYLGREPLLRWARPRARRD